MEDLDGLVEYVLGLEDTHYIGKTDGVPIPSHLSDVKGVLFSGGENNNRYLIGESQPLPELSNRRPSTKEIFVLKQGEWGDIQTASIIYHIQSDNGAMPANYVLLEEAVEAHKQYMQEQGSG
ncbi:hypothetical protein JXC34_06075 [Candidatus Woesearchaeota archaeon]|nr:hypothetical protein [Candidatus Woesearchaeota archaeon]